MKAAVLSVRFWGSLIGLVLLYLGILYGLDRVEFFQSLHLSRNTLLGVFVVAMFLVIFGAAHDVLRKALIKAEGSFYGLSKPARQERLCLVLSRLYFSGMKHGKTWQDQQLQLWDKNVQEALLEHCTDSTLMNYIIETRGEYQSEKILTKDRLPEALDELQSIIDGGYYHAVK